MASYRDKQNQKMFETESGKIAWCIQWIESHREWEKQFLMDGYIPLFEDRYIEMEHHYDYALRKSKEPCIYIISRFDSICDEWTKVVPAYCRVNTYKNVLDAQPWKYV